MKQPPDQPPSKRWAEAIQRQAHQLPYPPTPDVATSVMRRLPGRRPRVRWRVLRPAYGWLVLAALLLGLLAAPPVRAAIVAWLQLGAVRIWLTEPTPAATAAPTATPLTALLQLSGATTLEAAAQQAGFAIPLPTYPADLGPPDGVFYQELGGAVVVLVWVDPVEPTQARLSLHLLGVGAHAEKGNPEAVARTTVHGQPAFWTVGPYLLAFQQGTAQHWEMRRLVEGRVLIWQAGGVTYRLESNLTLAEAVQVAESLR